LVTNFNLLQQEQGWITFPLTWNMGRTLRNIHELLE